MGRVRDVGPRAALVVATLVVLFCARGYLEPGAPYGNDLSSHHAVASALAAQWRAGVFDPYYAGNNQGVALFLSYQPLPTCALAALIALWPAGWDPFGPIQLLVVLGWAATPWVWARAARRLGHARLEAAVFGLVPLALFDTSGRGLSWASTLEVGLFAQIFGMLLLPGAIAAFRHGVRRGELAPAALGLWLLCLSHALYGLMAGVVAVALVVAGPRAGLGRRVGRAARIFAATAGLLAFWLGPMLRHGALVGGLPWKRGEVEGTTPAGFVSALLSGQLLDFGYLPWLTVAMLSGLVVGLWPGRRRDRWILGAFLAIAALYLGPTTWGEGYRRLPLHREVNVVRYVGGLQLLAALWVARGAGRLARWRRPALAAPAVLALALGLASARTVDYVGRELRVKDPKAGAFGELVEFLRAGRGRVAVHADWGTGDHFHRDLLPALAGREGLHSYAMTFHSTLGTYYSEFFTGSAADCRRFGVEHLVRRREVPPRAPLARHPEVHASAGYVVHRCARGDPVGLIEVPVSVAGRPKAVRRLVQDSLTRLPTGRAAMHLPPEAAPERRRGIHLAADATDAVFRARTASVARGGAVGPGLGSARVIHWQATDVRATVDVPHGRPWLVFRRNAFPYWSATVDGRSAPIEVVGPNHMAVELSPGAHLVRFRYRVPSGWKVLAGLTVVVAAAGSVRALRRAKRRRRPA